MIRLFCVVFLCILLVSCGVKVENQIPPELSLKKTTELFIVFYPTGWLTTPSVGGGINVYKPDKTITVPISVFPYDEAKENDLQSIKTLTDTLSKTKLADSALTRISEREVSGRKAIWVESAFLDDRTTAFFLPLDGVVISAMVMVPGMVKEGDIRIGRLIVENIRLVK